MPETEGFTVEVGHDGDDAVVVKVRGELDLSTSPDLAAALSTTEVTAPTVQLDLSAVTFLDSSAIGMLVAAGTDLASAGQRLQIGPRSDIVHRVLEITGLAEPSAAFDVLPQTA